jgi:conjugative relaxase-like TrwC/TraI family protein
MMGRESVEYHRRTVIERDDDFPKQALAYYASRGETALVWGGSGAGRLGLTGTVTAEAYEAIYGPGGARHPETGVQLVRTTRPRMEIVISAHKSVAELGVIGRAEDVHAITDAERDATLAYLDQVTRQMGGRRGRARMAKKTSGLVYAHTRHATSRAGDPCPHDHVLLANLVEMLDQQGGWKAADSTLWREHLHAATMVGRMAAARKAVELGYGFEGDPGPSGRLGHWRIAGVPDEVLDVHSKRAAEIAAECERRGESSYQARRVAARTTRHAKADGQVEADLVARWQAELAAIGWPPERFALAIDGARKPTERLTLTEGRQIMAKVLAADVDLARRKVFCRRDVIVAVAPNLFGQDPRMLDLLVDRLLADPEVIPLVGVEGAREQAHSLASVLARERAIAESLSRQRGRADAAVVPSRLVAHAIRSVEAGLGDRLSEEQASAAMSICTSRRGAEIVVGVAGAGKTTMLKAVAGAFEASGYRVTGTATSGQAARNLGRQADLGESRTLASLIGRLDSGRIRLDDHDVILLDEVGMTDDVDLVRLAAHAERAGAKLVLIGDHRQLGAVGPGSALQALVARHPDAVHYLVHNRRQSDPEERAALDHLRDGNVAEAVSWYETHDHIHAIPIRDDALQAAVDAWAADIAAGQDAALYAWRRANVAALNQRAREWMQVTGRLSGPEMVCPGGLAYRAGDRVVTLAPGPSGTLVTSQRATVRTVDIQRIAVVLETDGGRTVTLAGQDASAERLGYGYATTVHRSQGATVSRSHLVADRGGRELAYVAMSRARQSTQVWTVADDLPQAVDDLKRDWSSRRTPTWAIDIGQPDATGERSWKPLFLSPEDKVRIAALVAAETNMIRGAITTLPGPVLHQNVLEARTQLERFRQDRKDLDFGRGTYQHTEAGQAIRDLREAKQAGGRARWNAEHHAKRWRDRRAARKEAAFWAERELDAQQRWETYVAPEAVRLDRQILHFEAELGLLETRAAVERTRYLASIRLGDDPHQDTRLERAVHAYRDRLDGIPATEPLRVYQHQPGFGVAQSTPEISPPTPGISM